MSGTKATRLEENAYGFRKRFEFISGLIEQQRPNNVLDVGCGTGEFLTIPLAERFPEMRFVGIDSDATSITYARAKAREQNHLSNLSFPDVPPVSECFDLVIASEVLEHVDEPGQFLAELRGYLSDHGRIVITTPNGYGPFEWASLIETVVMVARRRVPRERRHIGARDTLAISPHVNFFTRGDLRRLFARAALRVVEARSRTFLCGRGLDTLVRRAKLIHWNARIADRLPAWMSSDWMFVLEPDGSTAQAHQPYFRRVDARLRRTLNAKRWGTSG